MSDNLSRSLRLWLRQKAEKKTRQMTIWHNDMVKTMAERATKGRGHKVSQDRVLMTAVEMLSINFDLELFR